MKRIFSIFFIGFVLTTLIGCSHEVKEKVILKSILVSSLPEKRLYQQGDVLDLSGLNVIAEYSDGSEIQLSDLEYKTEPEQGCILDVYGDQIVKIVTAGDKLPLFAGEKFPLLGI